MDQQRTRTSGSISTIPVSVRIQTSGGVITTGTYQKGKTGDFVSTTDIVTPNFRKIVAAGGIVVNPFLSVKDRYINNQSGASHYLLSAPYQEQYSFDRAFCTWTQGTFEPARIISDSYKNMLITDVATSAMSKVAAPTLQGLVTLGELRETLNMLRNPIAGLNGHFANIRGSRAFQSAQKGRSGLSLKKFIEDNWMQYRYGIRPFIQDISAIADAAKKIINKEFTPRYTARAQKSILETSNTSSLYNDGTYTGTLSISTRHEISIRAGVLYAYDMAFQTPTSVLGFSLSDIPSAAWELVTLSFVVDWIANIGDFIAAVTPVAGVSRLGEWHVVSDVISGTRILSSTSINPSAYTAGWRANTLPSGSEFTSHSFKHRVCALPVGLTFKPYALKGILQSARIVDLVLIMQQRLK